MDRNREPGSHKVLALRDPGLGLLAFAFPDHEAAYCQVADNG